MLMRILNGSGWGKEGDGNGLIGYDWGYMKNVVGGTGLEIEDDLGR